MRGITIPDLPRIIDRWEPAERPVHCSNCLHAKVSGEPDAPRVHCAQGHGRERTFLQLCRAYSPAGFRTAWACPDFTSMDDDVG